MKGIPHTFGWRVEEHTPGAGGHATVHIWRGQEGSRGKLGTLTGTVDDIQELEAALAGSNARVLRRGAS